MKYRWSIAQSQPLASSTLARQLGISPLLAQCLLNRGCEEPDVIQRFLDPRLKNLADPELIPGMNAAVDRLKIAIENREPIAVFGDYDVDGVTSAAILVETLSAFGAQVSVYLPRRMEEGYGLTEAGAKACIETLRPQIGRAHV